MDKNNVRLKITDEINPLVSVIIPAYNSEKYIEETLLSAISQTYVNIEIIVVNDSSNDETLNKICEFQNQDSRILLIDSPINEGVSASRNKGVNLSKGEYICFLDADDIWKPEKIEMQLLQVLNKKCDFCYTAYSIMSEDKSIIKECVKVPNTTNYKKLLRSNYIACSTVMVKRELLINREFEKIRHEDYILWLKLAKNQAHMIGVNTPLMLYRKHEKSISSNKLKSATWVWNIYRNVENLNIVSSIICFISYTFNGIIKHFL